MKNMEYSSARTFDTVKVRYAKPANRKLSNNNASHNYNTNTTNQSNPYGNTATGYYTNKPVCRLTLFPTRKSGTNIIPQSPSNDTISNNHNPPLYTQYAPPVSRQEEKQKVTSMSANASYNNDLHKNQQPYIPTALFSAKKNGVIQAYSAITSQGLYRYFL